MKPETIFAGRKSIYAKALISKWCPPVVGFDEIIFIAIIALLLFGPDKLPEYIRELGRLYAGFKNAQRDLESEFNRAVTASITSKPPSATIVEIAKKMDIPVEGKTEEQLLMEIDAAVPSKPGKV